MIAIALTVAAVAFALWAYQVIVIANAVPHVWPSPGPIVTPAAPGTVPGLPNVGAADGARTR